MKVTFYSNFLNHHQLPFCLEMQRRLGEGFKFVATTPIEIARVTLGYRDMNHQYPFVITTYDNPQGEAEALRLCIESDVIITGSAPERYTAERIRQNKLTFRYSERVYKNGLWHVLSPRGLVNMLRMHTRYKNKNLYMLCASGYTAGDFAMVGAYKNKTYKWGYFPDTLTYDVDKLMMDKRGDALQILWCGRFLKLKHPEQAIKVAVKLKRDRIDFKLRMIGIGSLQEHIRKMILENELEDQVELLGSMSPEDVRSYMEKAHIFLFTSDYHEGWGAVLNEAMNSACAIVASHAIGSVPFLIKHGENGLVYKNGNTDDLYAQVKKLADDENLRVRLGRQAYHTLSSTWNAHNAAENFLKLSDSLLCGGGETITEGPCSKAHAVMQSKMYENIIEGKLK